MTTPDADSCGDDIVLLTEEAAAGCRAGEGGMYVVMRVGDRCVD